MPLQFPNRLVQCGSTQPSGPCHRRDSSMPQKPRIRRCHQPPLPFVQIRIQESMFCTQSGIVGHDGIIYFSHQKVQLILAGLLKWSFIPLARRLWTPPVHFSMIVVDAETGVFMMLYLDLAHDQAKVEGRLRSLRDLQDATMHGAVKRIRPKFMTVATMFIGLVPIMWSMGAGAGASVMRRIAAAMNVKPDPSA